MLSTSKKKKAFSFDDLPDAPEISFDDLPDSLDLPKPAPTVQAPEISLEEFDRLTNQPAFGQGSQQPVGNLLKDEPPQMPPGMAPAQAGASGQWEDPATGSWVPDATLGQKAGAVGKGILAGATANTYQPEVTPGTEGYFAAGNIPGMLAGGAVSALGGPAGVGGFGYLAFLNDLKARGMDPSRMTDPEIQAMAAAAGIAAEVIPASFGKGRLQNVASGAGLSAAQNVADEGVKAAITDTDPNYGMAAALGGAMGTGVGLVHKPLPRRGQQDYQDPASANPATPAPIEEIPFSALPDSPDQPFQGPEAMTAAEVEGRAQPPILPRERGLFDTAPIPEDMAARQWAHGTEAQTALREATAAREPLAKANEEALRKAVEAENALRSRFPDPDVSPQYPAERDLLRALSRRHQEAEAVAQEARSRLDEANTAMAGAKRAASRAQEIPVPDMPPERLQARQEAMRARLDAGLPPEHVQASIEAQDRLFPESYDRYQRKATDITPAVLEELGIPPGDNVSRETPALARSAPRINFETVDYGEGSPFQAKFPEIQAMDYAQKAALSKEMADFTAPIVEEVTGIKAEPLAPDAQPGFWESYPHRPNAEYGAEVPYEAMRQAGAAHGFLHQQDAVFIMKESDNGQKFGVHIAFEGGRPAPDKLAEFWSTLRKEIPDPGMGAKSTPEGLLIARAEHPSQIPEFQAKYGAAIERAEQASGLSLQIDYIPMDWELIQSGGWSKDGGGDGYLGWFAEGQRQRLRHGHTQYEESLRGRISQGRGQQGRGAFLQEHDPKHGGRVGNGPGKPAELSRRFGIEPAHLASKDPQGQVAVYKAMGNKVAEGKNTQADLKIYPLHDIQDTPAKIDAWLKKSGWNYKIFGPDPETGKFIPPDFANFNYTNKHAWIFSPATKAGSFGDTPYTFFWRVTHEVAHGQTNEAMTAKYGGVGKRAGALGVETMGKGGKPIPPLSLADALRAVEWEHEVFKAQRQILEQEFGIKITEEQFRKENATNMADAVYRVISGDFSDPGDRGMIPSAMNPDQALERAKDVLRTHAQDMGMDMAETFGGKKPEALLQGGQEEIKGAFIPSTSDKKGIIYYVKKKADLGTIFHEDFGHGLKHEVLDKNPELNARAEGLYKEATGAEASKAGAWTREAHEWLAQKVERYFWEGKTDVPSLIPLFEKIRDYMRKIYEHVVNGPMGKGLTEQERALFDEAFTAREKARAPSEEGAPPIAQDRMAKSTPRTRGAQPETTPPGPPRQENSPTQHVPGERSLPKTLEKHGLEGGADRHYEVKRNDATAKAALAHVEKHGADATANEILGQEEYSAESMAKFGAVMQNYRMEAEKASPQDRALIDQKAGALATEMAVRATSAGQFIQFISALGKYSRDGIVLYAGRVLEKWNRQNPSRNPVKLAPEKVAQLREAAATLEKAQGLEEVAKEAQAALGRAKAGVMSPEDVDALKAFRDRIQESLGDAPPKRPKGVLGGPRKAPEPKAQDSVEGFLAAKEKAALDRLRARGLKPTKALLQTATQGLSSEDVADLSEVFASRLASRGDRSVGAIRQNFIEAFGPEITPYLDRIAQAGAKQLAAARGERSRMAGVMERIDEILTPLLESPEAETVARGQELLESALTTFKELQGDAKLEASWDLQEALRGLAPSTWGQKAATAQYIAQLLNPKTTARNVISNELFYRLERLNKWVVAPIDWAKSALTGKERAVTFRTGGQGEYWKSFLQGAKAAGRGVNPEGIESKYDLGSVAFKSKKNPLFWLERALGVTLRATDYAAYRRAKTQTLGELGELAAMNKKVPAGQRKAFVQKFIEDADAAALDVADKYGRYVTFSDETMLSRATTGFKGGLNKLTSPRHWGSKENWDRPAPAFGVGNLVINYPKTPANLIMRGIDYSPAGILRDIISTASAFHKGMPVDERALMLSIGRGLTGSLGMTALAYYLADKGVLQGRSEKDKDTREFLRDEAGERNFQVNVSALKRWAFTFRGDQLNKRDGDTLISYDWMQPMALNIVMGAEMNKVLTNKKSPISGALATAEGGISAALSSIEEQPLLKGIQDLFDKNKDTGEKVMGIAESLPASFVPTFVNQVKQAMDNTRRETRSPDIASRTWNKFIYKFPFASESLPALYRTIGKDFPKEMYQDGSNTLFNVFLNPAFVNKYKIDPQIEAFLGPYEAEGRTKQFPYTAPKAIKYTDEDGEPHTLTLSTKEISELQRVMAQKTTETFDGFSFGRLKKMSYEEQEDELGALVKEAWEDARDDFLERQGVKR